MVEDDVNWSAVWPYFLRVIRAILYAAVAMLLVHMRPDARLGAMQIAAVVFLLSIPSRSVFLAEMMLGALVVVGLFPEVIAAMAPLAPR
jgi:hypothetical protein